MKKWISYGIVCLLVPLIIIAGIFIFDDKQYAFISLSVAILACIPAFLRFEKKDVTAKKLILIAIMAALSVAGRIIFAPLPGFKPVAALVVIAAIYLGSEAGFMTGAVAAVISNFYFGQGAWTPMQMFVWGLIGFVAGLIAEPLKRSKIFVVIYGIISGIVYSLIMDFWSVLWADGIFNISRYLATVITSAPMIIIYALSNVVFLLILIKPFGKILERIQIKYGL